MVRACCVSTCHSGKNVPSHLFPKNIERRKMWLENLSINSASELEMQKLRVCYKHFRNNDYSCSPTRRILKNTAIPSIHVPSIDENITTASTSTVIPNLSQLTFENNERIQNTCCKEQHKQLESQLQEQRQQISQAQGDHNIFVEQQQLKEQQQEVREQQQELILQQHGEQILQHQESLNQQAQEIQQLKDTITMHLQQSPKSCARPDLEDISRKNLLTPRARKLYEKTVQLKKQRRHLKRRIDKMKQQSVQKITKNRTNKKGRSDKTAAIRRQIIRMILRNSNVAPQV